VSATALLCLVIAVADGDTLTARCGAHTLRVRIAAIDAPESRQRFGPESRQQLTRLCWQQRARITPREQDKYGRTVAQVSCQGQDVASTQVRTGLAWVYTAYAQNDPQLLPLQQQARAARRGLWAQPRPLPPWSYRQRYGHSNRSSIHSYPR